MQNKKLTRRRFIALAGESAVALSLLTGNSLLACSFRQREVPVIPTFNKDKALTFTSVEWDLLVAVQDYLLPSAPGSPGARDVNATGYLDAALHGSDIDPSEKVTIKSGIPLLERLASLNGGSFLNSRDDIRESALREFEDTEAGYTWLDYVMSYTLEAYLGDPVYGGNPNGIVWQYLEHTPGFPRPELVSIENRR